MITNPPEICQIGQVYQNTIALGIVHLLVRASESRVSLINISQGSFSYASQWGNAIDVRDVWNISAQEQEKIFEKGNWDYYPNALINIRKNMNKLFLTARCEDRNVRHARIGVFQNGGKAGVLTVDDDQEKAVILAIESGAKLVQAARDTIEELRKIADPNYDDTTSQIHDLINNPNSAFGKLIVALEGQ